MDFVELSDIFKKYINFCQIQIFTLKNNILNFIMISIGYLIQKLAP